MHNEEKYIFSAPEVTYFRIPLPVSDSDFPVVDFWRLATLGSLVTDTTRSKIRCFSFKTLKTKQTRVHKHLIAV